MGTFLTKWRVRDFVLQDFFALLACPIIYKILRMYVFDPYAHRLMIRQPTLFAWARYFLFLTSIWSCLARSARGPSRNDGQLVCLVAASDGVWDNWLYADVSAFFLEPKRAADVILTNSAEAVTEAFMKENSRRAHANFGSQVPTLTDVVSSASVSREE